MNWINGPLDDKAIFWLGIHVFWWKRIAGIGQFISASAMLAGLLNNQHKQNIHARLKDHERSAAEIKIPRVIRIRDILKWAIPAAFLLSVAIAFCYGAATVATKPWTSPRMVDTPEGGIMPAGRSPYGTTEVHA